MRRSLLVTGTDTGIGKTTVASVVVAGMRRRRVGVGVMKPIETGCEAGGDGLLIPADAVQLRWASGCSEALEDICPYRLRAPLAPSVAIRAEGVRIEIGTLVEMVRSRMAGCEILVVEGAGGLLVPMVESATFADLARPCGLRVVVVVGNRLGAINHARLTIDWARGAGLDVAGYIVNELHAEADLAARTNVEVLREILGPSLGRVPFLGPLARTDAERDRLAAVAEASLDLDALLSG